MSWLIAILAIWLLLAAFFFRVMAGEPLWWRLLWALGWPVMYPLYWIASMLGGA